MEDAICMKHKRLRRKSDGVCSACQKEAIEAQMDPAIRKKKMEQKLAVAVAKKEVTAVVDISRAASEARELADLRDELAASFGIKLSPKEKRKERSGEAASEPPTKASKTTAPTKTSTPPRATGEEDPLTRKPAETVPIFTFVPPAAREAPPPAPVVAPGRDELAEAMRNIERILVDASQRLERMEEDKRIAADEKARKDAKKAAIAREGKEKKRAAKLAALQARQSTLSHPMAPILLPFSAPLHSMELPQEESADRGGKEEVEEPSEAEQMESEEEPLESAEVVVDDEGDMDPDIVQLFREL